ncbi:MAG: hypothetical protein RLZZ210_403 [Pseudomonadota bacterium]|jgi:epoxyqueuosine reductase
MLNNLSLDILKQIKEYLTLQARQLHLEISISDLDLSKANEYLKTWLDNNMHGTMDYMQKHAYIRSNPAELLPTAIRAIMVRINYNYLSNQQLKQELSNVYTFTPINEINSNNSSNYGNLLDNSAVISMYARGRDYHKVLRKQVEKLASIMHEYIQSLNLSENNLFDYRVFTDSAPIMEVELAQKSGLGWRGKHTLLINPKIGSLFFLGGMLTNLPLEVDTPIKNHCGKCSNCIDICPTKAIIAPYQVDARKCISYLTIEHDGAIPLEYRKLIGKHIYGCDECQLVCPWNKFAQKSMVLDFKPREYPTNLIDLWNWSEDKFLKTMEGTAIRRIGYIKWQRNIAVVMGNYISNLQEIMHNLTNSQNDLDDIQNNINLLKSELEKKLHQESTSELVKEHIIWSLKLSII